jgi:Transglutaminase-like superfamily
VTTPLPVAPPTSKRPSDRPSPSRRLRAAVAVAAARALTTQSPARIESALRVVSRGARPASASRAAAARDDVIAVSFICRGNRGCLPRSVATALLCRMSGSWPTWRVGVRTVAPFAAHAWVEAEGEPIGEDASPDFFRPLLTVPPPSAVTSAGARGAADVPGLAPDRHPTAAR